MVRVEVIPSMAYMVPASTPQEAMDRIQALGGLTLKGLEDVLFASYDLFRYAMSESGWNMKEDKRDKGDPKTTIVVLAVGKQGTVYRIYLTECPGRLRVDNVIFRKAGQDLKPAALEALSLTPRTEEEGKEE